MTKKKSFVEYCMSFYGPTGISQVGKPFTMYEVENAIDLRLALLFETFPFEGDSSDRELVRDLVLWGRFGAMAQTASDIPKIMSRAMIA